MKEVGSQEKKMERESTDMPMERFMKVIFSTAKNKVLEL